MERLNEKNTISKFEKINGNSIINKGEVRFYKNTKYKRVSSNQKDLIFLIT